MPSIKLRQDGTRTRFSLHLPDHHKVELNFFNPALLIVSMDTAFCLRRQNTATAVQSPYFFKMLNFCFHCGVSFKINLRPSTEVFMNFVGATYVLRA
jgi:hypothetical protein